MSRLFLFGGKKKLPLERGGRGLCKKRLRGAEGEMELD